MIKKVWMRLAILVALAVIPATLLQFYLQQDSLNLVFDLVNRSGVREAVDSYLGDLRIQAKTAPERTSFLRKEFDKASQAKISLEELFLSKDALNKDLRIQIVFSTGVVLILSILLGALVSNAIVQTIRHFLTQQDKDATKLKDLAALESWQTLARVLVHELRGPITPIKLIATDIEDKYSQLGPVEFKRYLHQARELLEDQVEAVELMIKGFTQFGVLPRPNPKPTVLLNLLMEIVDLYDRAFGENVTIKLGGSIANVVIFGDEKLLRDLFFNLFRNAAEANEDSTTITIETTANEFSAIIKIANSGKKIPEGLREKIFEPNVTTKGKSGRENMGLGLTIARKIALDHHGELCLDTEGSTDAVCFRLEIPLFKAT
jgi:nitrogen fixation/metabolism regulation signal transduction histidine kinase